MQTKHLCVLIQVRIRSEIGTNPSSNFLTDHSKRCFFFILFVICVLCLTYWLFCFLQPCGHLTGKGDLLAILDVKLSSVLSLSHMVFWVRYDT